MNVEFPERIEIVVDHVQQQFSWDCGIACFLMVLSREQRQRFIDHFQELCIEEGFKKSIWTIDLAYLLKRFNIAHVYCTITLGVDPGYSDESYYARVMATDEERITRRFRNAGKNKVVVENRHVELSEILANLRNKKPAIVLVNSNLLQCLECKPTKCPFAIPKCLFSSTCFKDASSYNGHFVVICGYDLVLQRIFYRNPSFHKRICSMSFEAFESARSSYGTDEDIIFIGENLTATDCSG